MPGLLPGDAASYLGEGTAAAMPDPPTNIAPNTVAVYYQTDTKQLCFYLNGTWACESWVKPVPPPPPGPTQDQWACNVAGFLTYDIIHLIVKVCIDVVGKPLLIDAIGILVQGLLVAFLPAALLVDEAFIAALTDLITNFITSHLDDWTTFVANAVLWSKFHCYIYGLIKGSNGNLAVLATAAGTAIALATGLPLTVANGLALILQKFGVLSSYGIPLGAFIKTYDCSNCAITGQSDGQIPAQSTFDLVVTDSTTSVPFTNTLTVVGGTISGDSPNATLTIPSGDLAVTDSVTNVTGVATIAFSVAGSVSSPATGEALVTFPPTLEVTDGSNDIVGVFKLTVSGAVVGGSAPDATLTIPVATIGVDDGVTLLSDISELTFSGATVSAGSTGQAIVTIALQGWELTDGTHDLTGVRKVTVSGATVGGTSPNATLSVPIATIGVDDGVTHLASISEVTFGTYASVSAGSAGQAIVTIHPTLELADGTTDLANVAKITLTGAVVGGSASAATVTVPGLELTDGSADLARVTKITVSGATVGGTAAAATLTVPVASIGVDDGVRHLSGISELTFGTYATVAAGSTGQAIVTILPSLELTDGVHDLTGLFKVTVSGATVGGSAGTATLTVPTLEVTDGTHTLTSVTEISTSSLVVGGSGATATLDLPSGLASALGLQAGQFLLTIYAGTDGTTTTVAFSPTYSAVPVVVAAAAGPANADTSYLCAAQSVTASGFTAKVQLPRNALVNTIVSYSWMAMNIPATPGQSAGGAGSTFGASSSAGGAGVTSTFSTFSTGGHGHS